MIWRWCDVSCARDDARGVCSARLWRDDGALECYEVPSTVIKMEYDPENAVTTQGPLAAVSQVQEDSVADTGLHFQQVCVPHRIKKKVENSKRSGSGAATVYKPSAAWFHEMNSFLGDTSEYRETTSTEMVSFSF
ncbi:hypothetical protein EVAR_63162_1 [Eumeta japonica]|uniref:Uncharacterized protein n=1 Tax=Eumeta variegata TaxID=151549 RepID=A0A4C1Z4Z1_EUMVA|nr:hypothetical protein EVAR_63162_1 [Eumeta japonica]